MSDVCIFCRIVAGSIPSHRVYEDDHVVAFLDLHPTTKGHTLVIPRVHSEDLLDATPEALSYLLPSLQKVVRGVCRATGAGGCNIVQNNGEVAGQVIRHLHVHIIPRYPSDGYQHWPADEALSTPEALAARPALADEIRAAISSCI